MATINLSKTTINLTKGDVVNLSKNENNLNEIMIGLGWSSAAQSNSKSSGKGILGIFSNLFSAGAAEIDCDAWVALLKDGRMEATSDLIYYGNKTFGIGNKTAIQHHGDNLIGGGGGDDEEITIYLNDIPNEYTEMLIGVTIYQAFARNQTFNSIKSVFVRGVDSKTNFEMFRFNNSDFQVEYTGYNRGPASFLPGIFIRKNSDWEFKAIAKTLSTDKIFDAVGMYLSGDVY